jgi:hypothetical protein
MNLYLFLTFYLSIFGVAIYAFAFADVEATGINGEFSRLLLQTIPNWIKISLRSICGEFCFGRMQKSYNYVVHEKNPILQLTYLIIINGAFLGWIIYGAPQLPTYLAGSIHVYGGYIGVFLAQYTFYLACSEGPGIISKDNLKCYAHQPYDGLLFTSGLYCTTCKVEKVINLVSHVYCCTNLTVYSTAGSLQALHDVWCMRATIRSPLYMA